MPAIDQYAPGQFAVQDASGNWVSYGGDQGAAERAYNTAMGYSNGTTSSSTGGFTTGGGYGYLPGALDAAQAAAQQQYLRDRLNNLEIPMSQAERQQLIAQMTGYYSPGGASASMTDDQALDFIWQAKPDLAGFFSSNGWDVSTPEQQRAAARNWLTSVDPANQGKTAQQVAQELGAAGGGFTGSGPGGTPTFAREQWNAANNQWTANFLGSKSGPQNYALYSQLQPTAAFGQVQGSPSWEQALASFWNGTSAQGAQQTNGNGGAQTSAVAYRQPASITASELNTMTPTQQAMRGSEWSYNGLDPNDMWTQANRARPTGQAALNTMWR